MRLSPLTAVKKTSIIKGRQRDFNERRRPRATPDGADEKRRSYELQSLR